MPIYEYACRGCEHQFETIQKISEDPLTECPSCGKSELKKLMSRAAFRLKGSGWYETDFKSSDKRNIAGESKPTDSSESSSASEASGKEKSTDSSKSSDSSKSKGESKSTDSSKSKGESKSSGNKESSSSSTSSSSAPKKS